MRERVRPSHSPSSSLALKTAVMSDSKRSSKTASISLSRTVGSCRDDQQERGWRPETLSTAFSRAVPLWSELFSSRLPSMRATACITMAWLSFCTLVLRHSRPCGVPCVLLSAFLFGAPPGRQMPLSTYYGTLWIPPNYGAQLGARCNGHFLPGRCTYSLIDPGRQKPVRASPVWRQ